MTDTKFCATLKLARHGNLFHYFQRKIPFLHLQDHLVIMPAGYLYLMSYVPMTYSQVAGCLADNTH
jgi:hypothetical protein